ncbi:hypothetical protein [Amycolatopsis antarctica]|uniref:hypothetical protein n=1 Tax=Amycolatopsis antarctica TaxID=1854586 RepID=UPI0013FDB916|nr:hypothetical protein [Amycolatopsis antarctica]
MPSRRPATEPGLLLILAGVGVVWLVIGALGTGPGEGVLFLVLGIIELAVVLAE